jgi:hypothetical protein
MVFADPLGSRTSEPEATAEADGSSNKLLAMEEAEVAVAPP